MSSFAGCFYKPEQQFYPRFSSVDILNLLRTPATQEEGYWHCEQQGIIFFECRQIVGSIEQSLVACPFVHNDFGIVVCFDGYLYNPDELMRDLVQRGYAVNSALDVELIATAYQEWGISFLERLDGMFSLALFDTNTAQLVLATDPRGERLLFVHHNGTQCSFSSDLHTLTRFAQVRAKIRYESIADYLTAGSVASPWTLYENMYQLPPASYLVVNDLLHPTLKKWEAKLVKNWVIVPTPEGSHYANFEKTLLHAVKQRVNPSAPTGVLASGGTDSNILIVLLTRFVSQVGTYHFFIDDNNFPTNKFLLIRRLCRYFRTHHYDIPLSEKTVFEYYQMMRRRMDRPFITTKALAYFAGAQFIARDIQNANIPRKL